MTETVDLAALDDVQVRRLLAEHGSQRALARHLGVPDSTLRDQLRRRGIATPAATPARQRHGIRLTRESLYKAMQPPNNCKVREFLDTLDDENLELVEDALALEEFPAKSLRDWLIREGFHADSVPGDGAIKDHRVGRRPCRCRG